jgi:hypothetical protein
MILYAWIVDAELFHDGEVAAKIEDYATLFYGIALTNVTEKGRTLYYQIVQNG